MFSLRIIGMQEKLSGLGIIGKFAQIIEFVYDVYIYIDIFINMKAQHRSWQLLSTRISGQLDKKRHRLELIFLVERLGVGKKTARRGTGSPWGLEYLPYL